MKNYNISNTHKKIWLFANVIVLLCSLYLCGFVGDDFGLLFIYVMYFITFPSGFLVPFVYIFIDKYLINMAILDVQYPLVTGIALPWLLFVYVGYLQWFVIIPKIMNFIKHKSTPPKPLFPTLLLLLLSLTPLYSYNYSWSSHEDITTPNHPPCTSRCGCDSNGNPKSCECKPNTCCLNNSGVLSGGNGGWFSGFGSTIGSLDSLECHSKCEYLLGKSKFSQRIPYTNCMKTKGLSYP